MAATFRVRTTFARVDKVGAVNSKKKKSKQKGNDDSSMIIAGLNEVKEATLQEKISAFLFPGLPAHYPFRKKVKITRFNTTNGIIWDFIQLVLALMACGTFAASTYDVGFLVWKNLNTVDTVLTQFFAVDFFINWYIHGEVFSFFLEWMAVVDFLTMLPTYSSLVFPKFFLVDIFRCLRILRVVRVVQYSKVVRELSGIQRKMITLTITITSMIFLAASFIQFVECDIWQFNFACKYINEATLWSPSCSSTLPAIELEGCDCHANFCEPRYQLSDVEHAPSGVRCVHMTFFDAVYFLVVTISTVGYGDVYAQTSLGRAIVIVFIVMSLIVIPTQISELQLMLSLQSPYRTPFQPKPNESHIVICGHVQHRRKMERFFQEFYHPDRSSSALHAVVLSPFEPQDEVQALIMGPFLENRVTYVIGSALAVEDLKKVHADSAVGMFFLCNTEAVESVSHAEDAAIVLRALSVSNFNPGLNCLVQVLRPEDRTILKDSDIDVILCLDEFKTAIIARNAICPGFATIIENIFHSMGSVSSEIEKNMAPWYHEYLHGAGMELYMVPLPKVFLIAMRYNYPRIMEAIFVAYDSIVLGFSCADGSSLIFNPRMKDIEEFKNYKRLFEMFNNALIIADDQRQADIIATGLADIDTIATIKEKLAAEEALFPCENQRKKKKAFVPPAPAITGRGRRAPSFIQRLGNFGGSVAAVSGSDMGKKQATTKLATQESAADAFVEVDSSDLSEYVTSSCSEDDYDELSDDDGDLQGLKPKNAANHYIGYRRMSVGSSGARSSRRGSIEEDPLTNDQRSSNASYCPPSDMIINPGAQRSSDRSERSGDCGYAAETDDGSDEDDDDDFFDEGKVLPQFASAGFAEAGNPISPSNIAGLATPSSPGNSFTTHTRMGLGNGKTSSPATIATGRRHTLPSNTSAIGLQSVEISNADHMQGHVIVTGCDANLLMFLSELRRPSVKGHSYHPIVIVSPTIPAKWSFISQRYNDVFYIQGTVTKMADFKRVNVDHAFSFVLLASRDEVTVVDDETVDSTTLFSYLKLEQYIPKSVFFSVELTTTSNMSVLNATILRRARQQLEESNRIENAIYNLMGGKAANVADSKSNMNAGKDQSYSSMNSSVSNLGHLSKADQSLSSLGSVATSSAATSPHHASRGRRQSAFEPKGRFMNSRASMLASKGGVNPQRGPPAFTKGTETSNAMLHGLMQLQKTANHDDAKDGDDDSCHSDTSSVEYHDKQGGQVSLSEKVVATQEHMPSDDVIQAEVLVSGSDISEQLWDAMDSHHVLPVFSSAKAFVPSSFESLLVQSFYVVLTPIICEKLVSGQLGQTVMQVPVPKSMIGRRFVDLFRLFIQRKVLCFGLYRAPQKKTGAMLPYVYLSPPGSTVLNSDDRVFFYGDSTSIYHAVSAADQLGK